ncbi:hypothetical protein PV327_004030 [Microctonus hyperodae]|uniref:Reticulon-like protein n=1 Tax=Microctonus hyperodae TaxID=165561 RepID=A0AA39L1N3_MICHY|nr:hypothetical protein PV327_004030 [Microctonus hyperodae]
MEKEKNQCEYQNKNDRESSANNIKRESESMDDFEHVEHITSLSSDGTILDLNATSEQLVDVPHACSANFTDMAIKLEKNLLDATIFDSSDEKILKPVPTTPPPSADLEKFSDSMLSNAQSLDPFGGLSDVQASGKSVKIATMAFIETEKSDSLKKLTPELEQKLITEFNSSHEDDIKEKFHTNVSDGEFVQREIFPDPMVDSKFQNAPQNDNFESDDDLHNEHMVNKTFENKNKLQEKNEFFRNDIFSEIKSTVLPAPENAPIMDFLSDETSYNYENIINKEITKKNHGDDSWNLLDNGAPKKSLPPLPPGFKSEQAGDKFKYNNQGSTSEFVNLPVQCDKSQQQYQQSNSTNDTGDSEFESEPESSPIRILSKPTVPPHAQSDQMNNYYSHLTEKKFVEEIAPRKIFSDMGLDAWFNPERLNPKVAALIYWRQPEKTGIIFGAIVGLLFSLAYFSLISVFSYAALVTLIGTMGFRIYKTIMQAVQKTSDGHPFKDILDIDLTLPTEKVHQVADVAVAHANAAVSELRRLFLIEDFVDSLKFSVVLWCLTYLGSWFNGMTLIIIGVVALFTLPKIYETNKAQIDQNLALVHGKINELTAKVKAAIPLGKKAEPAKEE